MLCGVVLFSPTVKAGGSCFFGRGLLSTTGFSRPRRPPTPGVRARDKILSRLFSLSQAVGSSWGVVRGWGGVVWCFHVSLSTQRSFCAPLGAAGGLAGAGAGREIGTRGPFRSRGRGGGPQEDAPVRGCFGGVEERARCCKKQQQKGGGGPACGVWVCGRCGEDDGRRQKTTEEGGGTSQEGVVRWGGVGSKKREGGRGKSVLGSKRREKGVGFFSAGGSFSLATEKTTTTTTTDQRGGVVV